MVTPPVELLVWDWNGTLVDDTQLCYEIANDMRQSRGLNPLAGLAHYKESFGFPVIDYYRRMGYTFESESYEDVAREFVRLYAERVPGCPLQAGAKETIAAVHARGIRQVLLSATGQEKLLHEVALFGMTDCFERIIGMKDNLSRGKADEARLFFEEAGVAPEAVLMIGDTDHDWSIAQSLGCRCLLLIPGHQTEAQLRSLGAPLIQTLPEVLGYLA